MQWIKLDRQDADLMADNPDDLRCDQPVMNRVIAEYQKEIDRLRLMEKNNAESWQHENKSVERMALAAFSVLNHPESTECRFELKQALVAMGFCPYCERRPCECECYDD